MKFLKKIVRCIKRALDAFTLPACAALALCAVAPNVSAQITPYTILAATNLPAIVTSGAASNTTSYVSIYNNSGLGLAWQFNVSSGTSAGVLQLYPTVDGTNYDTVPWLLIRNATAATDQFATTNWSHLQLRGYVGFKIGGMTNANGGTLTNKGVIFNRPTP